MKLGMEVRLGSGDFVLDGDPAPPQRGTAPNFRPMSVVANGRPSRLLLSTCSAITGYYRVRASANAAGAAKTAMARPIRSPLMMMK